MFFIKNNIINNNFLYKIYNIIRNIIKKEIFWILYSGGIDSNAFFFLIIKLLGKKNIKIIHINYNLNTLDKKYKNYCKKKKILIKISFLWININKKKFTNKLGIEATLRIKKDKKLKYINKIKKIKTLWINHHKNDIEETLLIQIFRGSKKLALSKKKFINKIKIKLQKINSLIKFKKNLIKKFILKNSIYWIEDRSNLNYLFERNKIRIKLIPKINYYIKNYKYIIKKLINFFNKRDVAERIKAFPC